MTDASTWWSATEKGMWKPHTPVPLTGRSRRVLHIATRFLRGGAERNIAHFVSWERAAGFEVELALGPDADAKGIPEGIPVHELKWLTRSLNPLNDLMVVRELRQLLRSRRYDIVHTHLSKAGIVGRIAARGVTGRVAHTLHMASFGDGYGWLASRAYRFAERRCAPMADVIAFVGNDLLRLYSDAHIVRSTQSMVIRSPIDLGPFFATRAWSDARRRSVRQDLGVDPDALFILAIGVLDRRKRYDLMLTEIEPMLSRTQGHLAIAGDGRERPALQRLAERLRIPNQLHLLGHLEDVATPLGAADLLVHMSSAEGVPQVVIQALAAGRPVIAADVTGLREIAHAPITIIPQSGAGLASAVSDAMKRGDTAVEPAALEPWTCAAIDAGILDFHGRLDTAATTT